MNTLPPVFNVKDTILIYAFEYPRFACHTTARSTFSTTRTFLNYPSNAVSSSSHHEQRSISGMGHSPSSSVFKIDQVSSDTELWPQNYGQRTPVSSRPSLEIWRSADWFFMVQFIFATNLPNSPFLYSYHASTAKGTQVTKPWTNIAGKRVSNCE